MKNILATFCLLCFAVVALAQVDKDKKTKQEIEIDRQIKGIIIAGVNLAQIDGDEVYGFNKVGINAGFGGILPLGHRFSFQVEVLYDERGAFRKDAPGVDTGDTPYYKIKTNYLSVPVLVNFEDRNTWTFGLGFSYGRMVKFSEIEHGVSMPWDRDQSIISYKTKDNFDILADIRFRLYKHLKLNLRYSYSLAKIRTRNYDPNPGIIEPWSRKQYHNMITIRLVYLLNEKYLPPREKIEKKKKKDKN